MPTVTATDMTGTSTIGPVPQIDKRIDTNVATEVPATPEAATPKPEDALNSKFAILSRNQQRLRQQTRVLEEQRRAFEVERKEIEQVKAWKERIKQDPYGVMLEQGLTSDQVASLMLNQPQPMDQNMLLMKQQLEAATAKIQSLESRQSTAQDVQLEAARKQILHDVKQVVSSDESFEAIRSHGPQAEHAVVTLIEETYNKDGYVMNTDDAIKEVEDYLVEEAIKLAQIKKVKSRLYPAATENVQAVPQKTQNPQKINTLSNRMVPSTTQPMSDKERRARAIAAFQGKI